MFTEERFFEFTVINPKKPKFIYPNMFTTITMVLVYIIFLSIIVFGFQGKLNLKIIYVFRVDVTIFIYFICFLIFIFGSIYWGHKAFDRWFIKKYLSKAKVHIKNHIIYIDILSEYRQFNTSYIIDLKELISYCICKTTTLKTIARNTLAENIGIILDTSKEKVILRLYDYRYFPFKSLIIMFYKTRTNTMQHYIPFDEIKGLEQFSIFLKEYVDTYSKQNNIRILHSVPVKWRFFRCLKAF